MADEKRLFLLDSYALIFRAYYAFINNPMRNNAGMNTSTVFGFTTALDDILRKENPTHIMAAFDAPGPTFRHELYSEYKANRDATPEDIKAAVPYIKRLLDYFGIPIVEQLGLEADDIIGTIAKEASKEGFQVFMVTPDKDFAQLVDEHIRMYKPGRSGKPFEILGVPEIKERFQVKDPLQVIDILALWGDSSDNIPGAPGIGEKTAKKLIASYESIEGVYENIDQLKGKQKENLQNSIDKVKLSKKLATIVTDADLDFDLKGSRRKDLNKEQINILFDELNFRNLKSRILGYEKNTETLLTDGQTTLFGVVNEASKAEETHWKTLDSEPHNYALVDSIDEVKSILNKLLAEPHVCFDTETSSLDVMDAELAGVSFSIKEHEASYIPFIGMEMDRDELQKLIAAFFEEYSGTLVGQNLKYDLHILKNLGIDTHCTLFDTMVAHYLVNPDRRHGIDAMSEELLSYRKIKTEELIGKKGKEQRSFMDLAPSKVKDYACEDADITFQVYRILKERIKEEGMEELAYRIEMPLVRVLMEMEHTGVFIDTASLDHFAEELRSEILNIETSIHKMAGMEFNVGSPKQLGEVLFDRMKIVEGAKKTKSKQYSTSEDVLQNLADKHEIVPAILQYRSARKLLSTYVEALPKLINEKTGRIHTSFNQTLVATGRLSSQNPNLQNIPIREERGRAIRRAFVSGEKHHFLSADYSQIELRLMAHLSKDEQMIQAFQEDEDIHTATAAKVFNVNPADVSRDMRSKAKTANFGIIYGISAFGLSQRMRISRTEAKELIEGYFNSYPKVKSFMDECIEDARQKGHVKTMFGRKRSLPDILSRNSMVRGNAERNAINTPIQGSAADIIKIAMVEIHDQLISKNLSTRMIIQVHDELNFIVPENELDIAQSLVRRSMENAVKLSVPLVVDMNHGSNWIEAH